MTRADYENKDFEELMIQLDEESDEVTNREMLLDFAISKIKDDHLFLAIHILEAVRAEDTEWYLYDYCMGTLQTPSAVTCKEDVEHMIYE